MSARRAAAGDLAFAACAAGFVALVAAFDVFAAGRWTLLLAALLASLAALPLLLLALVSRRRVRLGVVAIAWAAALLVGLLPWHPRKRFVRTLDAVAPGMSVDDVERAMAGYARGAGKKWVVPDLRAPPIEAPDAIRRAAEAAVLDAQSRYREPEYPRGAARDVYTGTMTYRWSDDGAYDSDWGQVEFRGGRVVAVRFLPD